ncbi:MAG: rod shape-determining protein MreC [Chthoniobacterales bacterium]
MMRHINWVIVIIVLLLAVILSTIGVGPMRTLKMRFMSTEAPLVKGGTAVQKQIAAMGKGLKTLDELETENAQLITDNKIMRVENQLLRDLEKENQKLRHALEYRQRANFKLLPARVIGRDASAWWNTIRINRGFEDGVEEDMTVVTEDGLVGKTTTIAKNECLVLLITDENCRVAAKVNDLAEQGILSGLRVQSADKPQMHLNYLTKNAALEAGQKISTIGVSGGVFPPGIPLGTIQSFRTRELDSQAIVTPAVDIPNVEDVFIVTGAK